MKAEQLAKLITSKNTNLTDAMQRIDDNQNGVLFVVDELNRLCGAVSDGDIRRWILKTGSLDAKIHQMMNLHPRCLPLGYTIDAYAQMEELSIRAIPVVDSGMHIVDIILAKERYGKRLHHADNLKAVSVVVMAGGKGTRLYPYTKILPKPLIPIGDVPIVERVIDSFYEYGVADILMTVNYKKNMIESYFADVNRDYQLTYIEETVPLGTAGSIKLIRKKFDRALFVANCDSLIRTDYYELYQHHQKSGNSITMVVAVKNDTIPYGVVHSSEEGILEFIDEKPKRSYLVNTGMYIINPNMIDLIPDDTFFHMTHLIEKAMTLGYTVGVYPVSEDAFLDMGEFAEMKRMEEKLNIGS